MTDDRPSTLHLLSQGLSFEQLIDLDRLAGTVTKEETVKVNVNITLEVDRDAWEAGPGRALPGSELPPQVRGYVHTLILESDAHKRGVITGLVPDGRTSTS